MFHVLSITQNTITHQPHVSVTSPVNVKSNEIVASPVFEDDTETPETTAVPFHVFPVCAVNVNDTVSPVSQ